MGRGFLALGVFKTEEVARISLGGGMLRALCLVKKDRLKVDPIRSVSTIEAIDNNAYN